MRWCRRVQDLRICFALVHRERLSQELPRSSNLRSGETGDELEATEVGCTVLWLREHERLDRSLNKGTRYLYTTGAEFYRLHRCPDASTWTDSPPWSSGAVSGFCTIRTFCTPPPRSAGAGQPIDAPPRTPWGTSTGSAALSGA